jgi:hypothetical protein
MKNFRFPAYLFVLAALFSAVSAQTPEPTEYISGELSRVRIFGREKAAHSPALSLASQIKNIQSFGEKSGIAYTRDAVFRTDSDGENWREIALPTNADEKVGAVYFENETSGAMILADLSAARLVFAATTDGGDSWTKTLIKLRGADLLEADLENARLASGGNGFFTLSLPLPTSSNFTGEVVYESFDNGQNWRLRDRKVEMRRDDTPIENISGNWSLKTAGICEHQKTGCVQETKVYSGKREITPPQIKKLAESEKFTARLEASNSIFASAPGGATRISLNRGFDKCTAATVAQMKTWWDNSPLYDVNIYFSGRNRGCTQAQLTAAWVEQVSAMGWGLIPTVVGYQAPCTSSTTTVKLSYDPATAEAQGRGEGDIAITDAGNLGLTQGTVLYYDMERYDETAATTGCRTAVKAFLKGWTDRLKERGYISGVYGSPTNAVADWTTIPEASRMDAVWLARYDNVPSVWYYAPPSPAIPDGFWMNHQRIKQWQGPHNETWGGVTFNIDGDIADGPVAGRAIPKNKPADFDGDGKSDVSVFRPDAGVWFVLGSASQNFSGIGFGNGSDILAPGDYDGDGKTDAAVFRPSEGNWYLLTKANTFSSRQFGSNGDIPVPADYNGDGKTDIAVFRPSNGVWYIANSDSRGTFTFTHFGATGDKPVVGDYDGDGKSDLAVWRPSNGVWYVLRSSDGNLFAAGFGVSTDQPAQGDFDGDGRTDLAVFRSGVWYLLQTTAGFSAVSFGSNDDLPSTGDFDGDNKTDIAVFRPSNGVWYILQSRDGFTATQFGNATDKPVPSAYLPQ